MRTFFCSRFFFFLAINSAAFVFFQGEKISFKFKSKSGDFVPLSLVCPRLLYSV